MVHTYFVTLKVPGLPTRIITWPRGNSSHDTGCHSAPPPPNQICSPSSNTNAAPTNVDPSTPLPIPPTSLLTHISESNIPSIKLFEKLGFRIMKWVEVFGEVEMWWGRWSWTVLTISRIYTSVDGPYLPYNPHLYSNSGVSAKFGIHVKHAIVCSAKLAGLRSFWQIYLCNDRLEKPQVCVKLPKDPVSLLKHHGEKEVSLKRAWISPLLLAGSHVEGLGKRW